MDNYKKYKVNITVRGSLTRPYYDGHVDVVALNSEEAASKAKRELKRTTFFDVGYNDFIVNSVERRWQ